VHSLRRQLELRSETHTPVETSENFVGVKRKEFRCRKENRNFPDRPIMHVCRESSLPLDAFELLMIVISLN
jgi:hypothetical protein